MYNHYYQSLNEEHRQQLRDEAAHRRQRESLPRRPGLTRHLAGSLGLALIALGLRLERLDHIEQSRTAPAHAL